MHTPKAACVRGRCHTIGVFNNMIITGCDWLVLYVKIMVIIFIYYFVQPFCYDRVHKSCYDL